MKTLSIAAVVTSAICALLAFVVAALALPPQSTITKMDFDRIQRGMTFQDVESILGPVDGYSKDARGTRARWFRYGTGHQNTDDEGTAAINFDVEDRVVAANWTPNPIFKPLGWLERASRHYSLGSTGLLSMNRNRTMQTVYEAAGGRDGLRRLASAWHARVLQDEVVSHPFRHGYHPEHSARLAAYWAEALGGPTSYSDQYGDETSVVRIHSGNGPHEEMDQRAIACFDQALVDIGLAGDERLRSVLHDYFAWATTTTMSRYHRSAEDVPANLRIPQWSWQGLVGGLPAEQE